MGNNNCSSGSNNCEQNQNLKDERKTTTPCASEFIRDDGSFCFNFEPSTLPNFNIYEKGILDEHNKFRKQHNSPSLFLSRRLCNVASNVACRMINTDISNEVIKHGYGENVYICKGMFPTPEQVVKNWYNEGEHYKYGITNYSMKTCHFTQLVWKKSFEFGVGYSKSGPVNIVIAIYSPEGNIEGCFNENVLSTQKHSEENKKVEEKKCDKDDDCKKICYKPISEFSLFHHECLKFINNLRKFHGVPDLKLSLDCCEHSLQRANYIEEYDTTDTMERFYGELSYIENIPDKSNFSILNVINNWYNEGKLYNYATPGFNPKTVNFSQIVWKNTTHMGSALLTTGQKYIFVINFLPPGNKKGQFAANILVPTCGRLVNGSKSCGLNYSDYDKFDIPHLTHPFEDLSHFTAFQKQVLSAHNELRTLHHSEPLELDLVLCGFASSWAKDLACKDVLEHLNDPNVSYGENMYMSTGNNVTAFMAVEAWYNENKKYNYKSPGFDPRSEHFTQVVWRNTKKLGTAVAQKGEVYIVVCFYSPKGNVPGEYAENVLEP